MGYRTSQCVFIVALIAAGIWQTTSVNAQMAQQEDWCWGSRVVTADQTISGCTAVINSGKYTGQNLTLAVWIRGKAYTKKGQYDRAIQDYDLAIKLDATYGGAFGDRGFAYANKGQYDRAIQDYDQAIKLAPDYAEAFYNRGNAYSAKGQYDRAIRDYDQAIKLDPDKSRRAKAI
jgi:tetratricopeptide (TPR) repeat protein